MMLLLLVALQLDQAIQLLRDLSDVRYSQQEALPEKRVPYTDQLELLLALLQREVFCDDRVLARETQDLLAVEVVR